ncbi:MAG: sugar transferase [Proteobacteria bacterium]|nr:sugar transferase [Desulfobacula sp.]MBU3950556.1 sugar transferase [Pseudomonadota bacterium]MBU4129191.1 sugar transferase [Pseudomonadota bacterium]
MLIETKDRGIQLNDPNKYTLNRKASGYFTTFSVLNRFVNLVLAVFFIVVVIPILVALIPIMLLVNGWPVLYAGIRMGRGKRTFTMYKLRTLPVGFEQRYDAQLVSYKHGYRLPWFSRFMRDTRLDELPQLFNVLKGDMDFIGPRPVRPSVYRTQCQSIKAYDKRFEVNPGLIGYAQLFTPHSTPKRIRSFIDNRASKYKKSFLFDSFIIFLTGFAVMDKTVKMLARFVLLITMDRIFKKYTNKRGLDRIRQTSGQIFFCGKGEDYKNCDLDFKFPHGILVDMNEEYLRMDTNVSLDEDEVLFRGTAVAKTKVARTHRKSFFCNGRVFKTYNNANNNYKYTYILSYEPVSNLNRYFVDQYFLKKSLMRYVI